VESIFGARHPFRRLGTGLNDPMFTPTSKVSEEIGDNCLRYHACYVRFLDFLGKGGQIWEGKLSPSPRRGYIKSSHVAFNKNK